jgi:hypothetical protein
MAGLEHMCTGVVCLHPNWLRRVVPYSEMRWEARQRVACGVRHVECSGVWHAAACRMLRRGAIWDVWNVASRGML